VPNLSEDVLQHRAWLLSFVDLPQRGLIVDLGSGRGEDLLTLAAKYPDLGVRLIGVDASEESLAIARAHATGDPRVTFQHHRLEEALPFTDASVDVVYSHNLLECLSHHNAFTREVARILRPGGQLVIGHWDWDTQVFDAADKDLVRQLVHAYADWQQAWMEHADGWMGRRLWGVFHSSGSFIGSIHARVLTNTRYSEPWFGHANAQALRSLVKRGLASTEEYEHFERDQVLLDQEGLYFYSITGYAYIGRRRIPAA
jgi:SAM-dependent methyltransferase